MTRNCFEQLNTRDQIVELYLELVASTSERTTTVGQVAASSSGSIPVTAKSWSVYVSGANGAIGGQAVPTGTVLSGVGPLSAAIAITTGLTTTVSYTYEVNT